MSTCPVVFPDYIPWVCVRDMVRMVRSGTLWQEKAEAMRHAGCCLGAAGNMLDDQAKPTFGGTGQTLEQCMIQLEAADPDNGRALGFPDGSAVLTMFAKKFLERLILGS